VVEPRLTVAEGSPEAGELRGAADAREQQIGTRVVAVFDGGRAQLADR